MLTFGTGARGGKRSVTHLSKAQLARKRANDREAQRNIRQRTKEHIENLEKKVKELEEGNRSSSMERILKRNKDLELEVEKLKVQVSAAQAGHVVPSPIPTALTEELMISSRKVNLDWVPEQSSPNGWQTSYVQPLDTHTHDIPVTDGAYTSNSTHVFHNAPPAMCYEQVEESEVPKGVTTPIVTPVWEDPMIFGQTSQAITQPTPAWAPFHPAFDKPSRFADLQTSGFTDLINQPTFTNTTCWQSQPSIYAWQISTKLKAPVTLVDQLMFNVIHSQRHLALHSNLSGEDLLGPNLPSVNILFNQAAPVAAKPPSNITEVMNRYSEVLSNRGFALIPEKLASFMCMYRFVQWQISPTFQTFSKLHEWQAPQPAQLMIPHPAWMDLPPWGKFRAKVIENQDRYDNPEFQNDYASNLSVNFPHEPRMALIYEDGQLMVSAMMDRHLSDINNMSMKKPFADKYPEFRDVCRFDEL
jgi:hypothetical protein